MRKNDILPSMARARRTRYAALAAAALAAGCAVSPFLDSRLPPESVTRGISGAELRRHVVALASDEFEGRAPGTHGEELTVAYLEQELRRAGAKPGNPAGGFFQDVPMIGIASMPKASFCVGASCTAWRLNEDFVGGSLFLQAEIRVEDSELV